MDKNNLTPDQQDHLVDEVIEFQDHLKSIRQLNDKKGIYYRIGKGVRRATAGVLGAGKIFGVIAAGTAGASMASCTSPDEGKSYPTAEAQTAEGGNDPDPNFKVMEKHLESQDTEYFGPPSMPEWDQPDYHYGTFGVGEVDGRPVTVFEMSIDGAQGVYFVSCEAGEDPSQMFSSSAIPQLVQGLDGIIGDPHSMTVTGNKLKIEFTGPDIVQIGTLSFQGSDLIVTDIVDHEPQFGSDELSEFDVNGETRLYFSSGTSIMYFNQDTPGEPPEFTELDGSCGLPDCDGVCLFPVQVNGTECWLGVSPDVDSSEVDLTFLQTLNEGSEQNVHPRILDTGTHKMVVFLKQIGGEFKMVYSTVEPYCGDGVCNGDESPATCTEDCPGNPDPTPEQGQDTAEPSQDADIYEPDVQPDGSGDADISEPDAEPDTEPDISPDTQPETTDTQPDESTEADESTPEVDGGNNETDTENPDTEEIDTKPGETTPPQEICDDGMDNDQDGLTDCEDDDCETHINCDEACTTNPGQVLNPQEAPPVTSCELEDGRFELTIDGEGRVVVANPFNPDAEPVELTITPSEYYDGAGNFNVICYQNPDNTLDCGADEYGINIQISEDADGYKAVVNGCGVSMASAASEYELNNIGERNININGEDQKLTVVKVASFNQPDESLAYIYNQNEGWYFDVPSDGRSYIVNAESGVMTLINEGGSCDDGIDNDGNGLTDCEDPGCALSDNCLDPVDPKPDNQETDTSGADSLDSSQVEENNGGGGNGCNQGCESSNEKVNTTAIPSTVVMTVLAFLALRRKRNNEL
ncbi:hypothetical protein GF366_03825 [Candidatus Peregrinibacteria bacterium]|nr:hypothetical protein [Candidatus Peregrinibacteria bacterium]